MLFAKAMMSVAVSPLTPTRTFAGSKHPMAHMVLRGLLVSSAETCLSPQDLGWSKFEFHLHCPVACRGSTILRQF